MARYVCRSRGALDLRFAAHSEHPVLFFLRGRLLAEAKTRDFFYENRRMGLSILKNVLLYTGVTIRQYSASRDGNATRFPGKIQEFYGRDRQRMIHPTAIVSPKAEIGNNVEIGPYAVIDDDVRIGDDCYIDAHVKIAQYTTLGARCRVYFGALVGAEPQDHRFYKGIRSSTEIGHDTVIREYVTIHRPPFEFMKTVIGSHVLLMSFVHVAHDVVIADRVTIANHTALTGHIRIGEGAVLSGYTKIHQFCRIGSLAMIGAGCLIGQDVPPFCMLRETNFITGPNTIGLRRAGMPNETRLAIRRAIKTFFFEGLNTKNALERIESQPMIPEVRMFVNFIKESNRGIMPGNPKYTGVPDDQRDEMEQRATAAQD